MIVTILGLGLMGGSLGAGLRAAGNRVIGHDLSARHGQAALHAGLIDELAPGLSQAVAGADTVILAVPVLRIVDLLPKVDVLTDPGALIVDVGSTKRVIVDTMAALPGADRMVGGHPLAGSEATGPHAADIDLFRGRTFFIVPNRESTADMLDRAADVARSVGASPVAVDAGVHDRVLASTSQLPQLLSTVLAASVAADLRFLGPGFRDMTRLAASDSALWRDILLSNSDNVVQAGRGYVRDLDALLDAIETGDVAAVESVFEQGRKRKAAGVSA